MATLSFFHDGQYYQTDMFFREMISNYITDSDFTIHEKGVLDFIRRKTFGFDKQMDGISVSQFVKGVPIAKGTFEKIRKKLSNDEIIHYAPSKDGRPTDVRTKGGNPSDYALHWNFIEPVFVKWYEIKVENKFGTNVEF